MIIAAAIGNGDQIVPIIEGTILRLYDTDTRQAQDFENPAAKLTTGRRGAALLFAGEHQAAAFLSPPETFCELSYEKAKSSGVRFYKIGSGLTFHEFLSELQENQHQLAEVLPEEDVVPSL